MTLIIAAAGKNSIWMATDRRLSYPHGRYTDDATKVLLLGATEGPALLAYAGLGKTAAGMEPSQWMSNTLRGYKVNFYGALVQLAKSMGAAFPRHMGRVLDTHVILGVGFVRNEHRLYRIGLTIDRTSGRRFFCNIGRVLAAKSMAPRCHPVIAEGSGASHLRSRTWQKEVRELVKRHDSGKLSAATVADHLAKIIRGVSKIDKTVSRGSIVAWRYRTGAPLGGATQRAYDDDGTVTCPTLPNISSGMDMVAIGNAYMEALGPGMLARLRGTPIPYEPSGEEILSTIPHHPDDRLA